MNLKSSSSAVHCVPPTFSCNFSLRRQILLCHGIQIGTTTPNYSCVLSNYILSMYGSMLTYSEKKNSEVQPSPGQLPATLLTEELLGTKNNDFGGFGMHFTNFMSLVIFFCICNCQHYVASFHLTTGRLRSRSRQSPQLLINSIASDWINYLSWIQN